MSESKHTPGPWSVSANTTLAIDANGSRVAWTWFDERTEAECVANARLIAAAPDMLAALERAASDLAHLLGRYADVNPNDDPTLEVVRAAIAKARGKS